MFMNDFKLIYSIMFYYFGVFHCTCLTEKNVTWENVQISD